jgi:hypothetical protein
MINKSLRIKALLVLVCLSFNSVLFAQDKSAKKSIEAQKEFLVNYLKTFDTYISNPDSFAHNKANVLNNFESQKSKTVYNFINPVVPPEPKRKNSKPKYKVLKGEFISAEKLVSNIEQSAPDGLGMSFNKDKIELVGKTNSFTHKTFVLKAPVEYSGFRKDGSLVSYANDQYFYINSTSRKNKVGHIKEKKHFEHTFLKEQRRKGLFIELSTNAHKGSWISGVDYHTHQFEYVPMWSDYVNEAYTGFLTYFFLGDFSVFNSHSLSFIYMFTPGFGIGTGYTRLTSGYLLLINAENYQFSPNADYTLSIYTDLNDSYYDYSIPEGYYYNNDNNSEYLEHRINMTANTVPLFIRLQTGRRYVTLSTDIGLRAIIKPTYENYLDGSIRLLGINKLTGETTVSGPNPENPDLPLGKYTYNNEFIGKEKGENLMYFFWRLNLNIQPTKHFYVRLSSGFQGGNETNYNKSKHSWDMYGLNLPTANATKQNLELFTEVALGININNLIP